MAHTSGSTNSATRNTNLAIRTHNPGTRNDIITAVEGNFILTQADRCPISGCVNSFPHRHSSAERTIPPSIDEFQKADEAMREFWTQEQRRRIVENEAILRQLDEIQPKVKNLAIETHLPRGNDLTIQEKKNISQTETKQTSSIGWDDFPKLGSQYGHQSLNKNSNSLDPTLIVPSRYPTQSSCNHNMGTNPSPYITHRPYSIRQNTDFLQTNSLFCTGPCPIRTPHNQGAYLQRGQVPRIWNARWGYSDPPWEIWEAWVRIEQGRARGWDQVEVDGFALSHWWAGPEGQERRDRVGVAEGEE